MDELSLTYLLELLKEKDVTIDYRGTILSGDIDEKAPMLYEQVTRELERTKGVYLPALEKVVNDINNRYNTIIQHLVEDPITFEFTAINPFVQYLIENDYLDFESTKLDFYMTFSKNPLQDTKNLVYDELIHNFKQTVNYEYREWIDEILMKNSHNYEDLWNKTFSEHNKWKEKFTKLDDNTLNLLYIMTKALLSKYQGLNNSRLVQEVNRILTSIIHIYKLRVDSQYKQDHNDFINLRVIEVNNRSIVRISAKTYERFLNKGGSV